jgi:hypothetical protein
VHSWKNTFHVHEHALVSYLTTQELLGQPAELHYAFKEWPRPHPKSASTVHPYMFLGKIDESKAVVGKFSSDRLKDYRPVTLFFTNIR